MLKKNVMFIIGQMKTGGAERTVCNLCNNLKDKYNITLVVRSMKEADYIPNVNIIEIPELGSNLKLVIGLFKLKKMKKQLKIDTSVSFLLKYNVYNYLSKYKDKVIISVRNYITANDTIHSKKNLFLYRKIIKKADLIVNVSKSVMNDSINNFHSPSKKNIVIPNFCELDYINSIKTNDLPKEHKKIFKGNIIISSGRYTFQKGQWHLIRAFQKVIEYDKNAKLVLTGRGKLKEYYQNLVKELGLEKNVYILDYVENVYSYMHKSTIYILDSFYEGMPNVLLEAMACDLPIIATDSFGGTKEILSPNGKKNSHVKIITPVEYGVLIPTCDKNMYSSNEPLTYEEKQIAESIILLLKDKKLYKNYKKASQQRVKDFSKEKILKMWENIL